jgi:hypothetical protein
LIAQLSVIEMAKKYIVALTPEEQQYLEQFSTTGRHSAAHITHARILLKANTAQPGGSWCDEEIASALDVTLLLGWVCRSA